MQFVLKHILFFVNLYCSKADFLKNANFLKNVFLKDLTNFIEKLWT
jgi:hypothetical protein